MCRFIFLKRQANVWNPCTGWLLFYTFFVAHCNYIYDWKSSTSMPKRTTCFTFPLQNDVIFSSTSGNTIVNFVFGNVVPCAMDSCNSCTVEPKPFGYCSVTTNGISRIFDPSVWNIFWHEDIKIIKIRLFKHIHGV